MKEIYVLIFALINFTYGQKSTDDLFISNKLQPISEKNIFSTEGWYNWGSSIIKGDDGKYHLFYSRWKREFSFTGWLTHSEIAHAVSEKPTGPWKYLKTELTGRRKKSWDEITAHNPKIKYFDGKYYLYYISTNYGDKPITDKKLIETALTGYKHRNWKTLRENQRTGVAVSNSINGPWKRLDNPIIEPSGPITTLTVNPAIDRGKDSKYYLVVKGDKPNETKFIRNQAVAVSDSPVGPFKMQDIPVIDYLDTEDISMWYDEQRDRFYGVFHAHEFIGKITSSDGINWKKANEYVLMPKRIKMSDGRIIKSDRLERPFIFVENGKPTALTLAVKKGDSSFTIFIPIEHSPYPLPNKRQIDWQEAELGVVFHYDLHVFDGIRYGQGNNRIAPVADYNIFNPTKLDTDQWIKAAKDMGAKFAILTATHETGFALYQSDVNPYCLKAVKWKNGKGDIVKDFVESCRKYDVKPGIYVGIRWNSFYGVHDFKVNGEGEFGKLRQEHYKKMCEGMVRELCTNYGELFEIWFDGGADHPENGAPDVLPIVQQYQPNCLFYHNKQYAEARWGGSESGTVPYPCWSTFPNYYSHAGDTPQETIELLKHGDPNGNYWMPAMSDAPLRGENGRHEWFWEPGDENNIEPLEDLMEMYYKSVGRNSTLIIGLTPGPNGLMSMGDVKRLKEWGDEVASKFSNPVSQTSGVGNVYILELTNSSRINNIVIQENIRKGERVRKFIIEGFADNKWNTLSEGSCISHKRIIKLDNVLVEKIRLTIQESIDIPQIKSFKIYE